MSIMEENGNLEMNFSVTSKYSVDHNNNNVSFPTATNETVEHNDDDVDETARMIYVSTGPILVVFGTIGNLLTFCIMRRGSLKNVSTCFYMAILALADTGVLWSGAFLDWMVYLTYFEVNPDGWTNCRPGYFIYHFCSNYSSALLAIMSCEKFLVLYFPFKTKSISTVHTSKWVTFITAIIYILFHGQLLFMYDVHYDSGGSKYCEFTLVDYEPTFNLIDSILYSFAPFVLMILSNAAIIYKFMKSKWKTKNTGTESTSQALSKSATKGTAMLVTVSLTFIILTAPVSIIYAINDEPPAMADAVSVFLQYLNHSINGVLYCITGSKFRTELLKVLHCTSKNKVENIGSVNRSTTNSNV